MASADFNRDGWLDVAHANIGRNSVTVLLNDRGSSLVRAREVPVGTGPFALATADFNRDGRCNNDGRPDVIYTGHATGTVQVLPGDGAGAFTKGSSVTIASTAPYTAGTSTGLSVSPDECINCGVSAHLEAEYNGLQFTLEPIDPALSVKVDQQLLASAVTNLLSNAFKYTRPGGRVTLRARGTTGRVAIEVEDACGGIPETKSDLFQPFGERRTKNRSGLGLGLSIARKAVRAQGGDIEVRNRPGKGCTFVIEVPAAVEGVPPIAVGDPAL